MNELSTARLFVVILNWNRPRRTMRCSRSVLESGLSNLHLVLVDNHSADDSMQLLQQTFPEIHLICNEKNLGYAGGNNAGIAYALQQQADYILLLNDDMVVQPDTIRKLVETAVAHNNVAAVGGQIRLLSAPEKIWAMGEAIPRGKPLPCAASGSPKIDGSAVQEIDYAVGCCILMRSAALRQIGLLDERFFAIYEEVEWCYRARKAGFRIVYNPAAIAYHDTTHSFTGSRSPAYHFLFTRNKLLFWQLQGVVPDNWQRLHAVYITWLSEVRFILSAGGDRGRRIFAASCGALAYLFNHVGAPLSFLLRH